MTNCSSTQPLAGSPLALPLFVHLYFSSTCCSFFLPPETQAQQTPGRFILLCSQTCALLGEAVGQHPGATPKAAPQSGPHLWPWPGPRLCPAMATVGTASAACPWVWICNSHRENFLLVIQDIWYMRE